MTKQATRTMLSLHLRAFPGWDTLRAAIAGSLGLPVSEVRGLREDADPAVRLEALASVMGFRLRVELYIDAARSPVPTVDALAVALARRLALDAAYHDGSRNPYAYVLVRQDGRRFATFEIEDGSDGLKLDESPEALRPLPPAIHFRSGAP